MIIAGQRSGQSRRPHKPEIAGSNPAPATRILTLLGEFKCQKKQQYFQHLGLLTQVLQNFVYLVKFPEGTKAIDSLEEVYKIVGKENVNLVEANHPKPEDVFTLKACTVISPETYKPYYTFRLNRPFSDMSNTKLTKKEIKVLSKKITEALVSGETSFSVELEAV